MIILVDAREITRLDYFLTSLNCSLRKNLPIAKLFRVQIPQNDSFLKLLWSSQLSICNCATSCKLSGLEPGAETV
jgi:hypothetical protein